MEREWWSAPCSAIWADSCTFLLFLSPPPPPPGPLGRDEGDGVYKSVHLRRDGGGRRGEDREVDQEGGVMNERGGNTHTHTHTSL